MIMYRLTIETIGKKARVLDSRVFEYDKIDTPAYQQAMEAFSEAVYNLDIEFDEVEGDGDMAIDDILIDAADAQPFEKSFKGRREVYRIEGRAVL